ncbi:hypothetical protein PVA45_05970 [Entomospira entomophila]|uniref:Uncharacterized protein n=1 Tax=Entomospira entomophila TaxID=2719988 RepID=A0A968G9H0_9SPIO|nr:hypothetical protein [Entomospira entomophilus]NIZ41045.1 hypothetical protein [Entomospira entomophilus]WDI35254.1 hypothetical protein PVA45_05970 [Entomospira entomophilus]
MKKWYGLSLLVIAGVVAFAMSSHVAKQKEKVVVNSKYSTYFKVYSKRNTIASMKKFRQIFDEIEAGDHLPQGDSLVIPDAKSAADAMIRYFYEDTSMSILDDILEYIPFYVGYYKGVWYVFGLYEPKENRVVPNSLLIADENRPRILLRARDGKILGYRTNLMDPIRE